MTEAIIQEIPPIDAGETLIRHVHPDQWNWDEGRPMSAAFADPELSVDREAMRAVEICCQLRPGWGFATFPVQAAFDLELQVQPDPLGVEILPLDTTPTLEYNPAHAVVLGAKKRMRRLRDQSNPVRRPGDC